MRILKLCLGATLVMGLIAAGFAHAEVDQAGTNAANFLSVGTGARILGMGGATLGLGDDVGAVAWNPAALGWTGSTQVVLSHAGLTNESLQEWMAVGGRLGRTQTRASVSALYQGDGSIEGRDAANNPTGAITASSFAVAGQLAQRIGHTITLGVTGKAVNEKLGDVSGTGYTWDAGMMVRVGMVGFGVAGQSLTGRMDYDGAQYPFPRSVGAGIGVTHEASGLRFALDANFPDAYYDDVRAGVEWMWRDVLALRTGYRHELNGPDDDPLTGPSFGIGAGKNGFWLDYGYLVSNDGGGQHRVGLKFLPALWNGLHSDPFGQKSMPREFDPSPPPASKGKKK